MRKLVVYVLLAGSFTSLSLYIANNISGDSEEPARKHKCGDIVYATYQNDPYMEGVLGPTRQVTLFKDYYKCNEPQTGDLVYYEYSRGLNPILRMIDAVPGDHFEVIQVDKQTWHVKINDKTLKHGGHPYIISSESPPVLKRLSRLQNGVLKNNEYLLFTFTSPGAKDSSEYGIVMLGNLIGRVVPAD